MFQKWVVWTTTSTILLIWRVIWSTTHHRSFLLLVKRHVSGGVFLDGFCRIGVGFSQQGPWGVGLTSHVYGILKPPTDARCDLCAIATADLIAREFLGEGWSKVPSLKDVDEFLNLGHVSQSLFLGDLWDVQFWRCVYILFIYVYKRGSLGGCQKSWFNSGQTIYLFFIEGNPVSLHILHCETVF